MLQMNLEYKNNMSTIFSWLKRCIPVWTPPGDFVYLSEYVFWLHPWNVYLEGLNFLPELSDKMKYSASTRASTGYFENEYEYM